MTKVNRNLDNDSNLLLNSMRQQEKQFEELSKELKLENSLNSLKLAHNKKLKRRSYSDYQAVTRKFHDYYNSEGTKENSETESKRDFLHNETEARKRASSSLGISSCQQDENQNTNNNNFVGYTTSTQMYNQPYAPYGNHHYVPYHHYPQLFHHNYQQHVNRMMSMQQNIHNEMYYPINRYNAPYYLNHNMPGYQQYQQYYPNNSPVIKKQHNIEHEIPMNQSKPLKLPPINKRNYPKWKTSTPSNQELVYSPTSNQDSVFLPPTANQSKLFSPSPNHVRSYSTRERKLLNRDDIHRHSYHFGNSTSDQLYISDESMTVKITEIIHMLKNSNYQESVSNAAAYIQHVTYGDDVMKSLLRRKGVVPVLVGIINNNTHHKVIINSLGALKNMVYNNTEGKMSLANCGGLSVISRLLLTCNMQVKILVTGILWNLTSCEQLKREVGCQTMNILIEDVILKYVTMLEPERTRHLKVTEQKENDVTKDLENLDVTFHLSWLKIITNSTGCIRNLSCSGIHIRKQLRNYPGFIEALLLFIENVVGKQDIDCTAIENIVSILRNLSYHIEEQHEPLGGSSDEESVQSCFKFHRKKSKDAETLSLLLSTPEPRNYRLLVHPTVVRKYLALLSHSTNPQTLQSAAGCLQNISAGSDSQHATVIRKTVRKLKGLPMLVELLHKSNNKVVEVVLETLTNLSFDERNKLLLGKHCMGEIIQVASEVGRVNLLCQLLTSKEENCATFYSHGGVERIIELKNNNLNSSRVVRGCTKVLQILWSCKSVKQQMKKKGWNKPKLFDTNQLDNVNLSSSRQAQASPLVATTSNNSRVYNSTNQHSKMDSWV